MVHLHKWWHAHREMTFFRLIIPEGVVNDAHARLHVNRHLLIDLLVSHHNYNGYFAALDEFLRHRLHGKVHVSKREEFEKQVHLLARFQNHIIVSSD